MKRVLIVAVILFINLIGCPSKTGPAPIINDLEYCKIAETHLKDLKCIPKDKPYTVKGKSFEEFCQETMQHGIDLSPKCLSEILSCDQMNICVQKN